MPARGQGYQFLGTGAQPLFGMRTTAPITPTPDMRTSRFDQASAPSQAIVSLVLDPNPYFRVGDHVLIGSPSDFGYGPSPNSVDGGVVSAVSTTDNQITVNGLTRRHNASEWAVLAIPCAQIGIQNNTSEMFIGEDSSVADGATSPTLIGDIAASGSFNFGYPSFGNVLETQHLWVSGTSGDKFLSYLITI